ncbi:MAG: GNAT family protein [Anaerolineae bacterium]|jgi:aminoglycoside 6'-N-acetyltransferase
MIKGTRVLLRPIEDKDWPKFEAWGKSREALWGPFQRFQMDHVPLLGEAQRKTGLLTRESGFLLIETIKDEQAIGFVRYTMLQVPDADVPHPEIGFGIPEASARGKGYATEAVGLLVEYLFAGYPIQRVAAFTDHENEPAQRVLEKLGFQREGTLRCAMFRDGQWRNIAMYSILRDELGEGAPPGSA